MDIVIMEYMGSSMGEVFLGVKFTAAVFIIGQIINLMEICFYVKLFRFLYSHNQSMVATVSANELGRRRKGNVTNLTGQAITFLVETSTVITVQVFLVAKQPMLEPAGFPAYLTLLLTLVNLAQFSASPELRRHYL